MLIEIACLTMGLIQQFQIITEKLHNDENQHFTKIIVGKTRFHLGKQAIARSTLSWLYNHRVGLMESGVFVRRQLIQTLQQTMIEFQQSLKENADDRFLFSSRSVVSLLHENVRGLKLSHRYETDPTMNFDRDGKLSQRVRSTFYPEEDLPPARPFEEENSSPVDAEHSQDWKRRLLLATVHPNPSIVVILWSLSDKVERWGFGHRSRFWTVESSVKETPPRRLNINLPANRS